MQPACCGKNVVMDVNNSSSFGVNERREFMTPLTVVMIVISILLDLFPSMLNQCPFDAFQNRPRHQDIQIRLQSATGVRQSRYNVGGSFQHDEIPADVCKRFLHTVDLPPQHTLVKPGQIACRIQVVPRRVGQMLKQSQLFKPAMNCSENSRGPSLPD